MIRLARGAALGVVLVLLGGSAASAADAVAAFRLQDPRITEASGIAAGVRSPGIVYVQNDSGDVDRVFALDARTGATAAVVTVAGAVNHDWEDLAVAPDAAGTPSLWIADIGDNDSSRREVQVYRVDEPHVSPAERDRAVRTSRADVWRVRYPSGPSDAESVAVDPAGTPYVVTKSPLGRSTVYRLPRAPDSTRVRTAVAVGTIAFADTGTPNPFGTLGMLAATGAALSSDGSLFVVRTYADAWFWHVGAGGLAAALRTRPVHEPLPEQPQGEGVAVTGDRLLVDSEGRGTAVWSVPLPAVARSSATPASSPTPTPSPAPTTAPPDRLPSHRSQGLAVLGAVLFAGAAVWLMRRRRD